MSTWNYPNKPAPMTTVKLTVFGDKPDESGNDVTYEGTVLDYDESGEFALIVWEDGTRDYRYIHQGYDVQMNETMEW